MTASTDDIPIKEYMEFLFNTLEKSMEQRFNTLDRELERQTKAYEKALELQAKEYERRLGDLNHEAEQLKSMQGTYVRQDVYETYKDLVNTDLRTLREAKSNDEGRRTAFTIALGVATFVVSTAVSLAIRFIGR